MNMMPDNLGGSAKVGIVTVTYNSSDVIDDFVLSLQKQSYCNWRLIVVDNDSKDGTLSKLEACWWRFGAPMRQLDVIANRQNIGVAEGNNQGIRAALDAGCTHVLLLNNDTVFGETLLAGLLNEQSRLRADMVVPKMVYYDQPGTIWCAGGYFIWHMPGWVQHYGLNEAESADYARIRDVAYAPTTCMLIDKSVFDDIGMMNAEYFVYYDDVDFCFRAKKAGKRLIYVPSECLRHKVSSLTGGETSPFYLRYITRNRALFVIKNYPAVVRELALAYQFLWMIGSWLRHQNDRFLKTRLSAFAEGLKLW